LDVIGPVEHTTELDGNGRCLAAEPAAGQTLAGDLTVEIHESPESAERLRPEWETLLREYPFSTTFSTHEWLIPWWRAFSGEDQLLILAFRDSSSSLIGLAPMAVTRVGKFPNALRLLRLMGDGSHDSDNLDFPVRPGWEKAFSLRLLDWMQDNSSRWDVCQLNTLPSNSLILTPLLQNLEARGWKCFTSTRPQTVVKLAESWEAHLKGISSKERGKIGLRARRLEKKYEMRVRRCSGQEELNVFLEALFELHGKHWQERGLHGTLHSPLRRQFYREMSRLLLERQRLEFWALELNGRIVATQFGLRHEHTVFSLQEGFDPDYAPDSVGYVLRSQVIKQLISEGIRCYDFLGGTDDSKMRWGAEVRNYLNLRFARPYSRGGLYLAMKRRREETKNWLRAHLPSRTWQALKRVTGKGS